MLISMTVRELRRRKSHLEREFKEMATVIKRCRLEADRQRMQKNQDQVADEIEAATDELQRRAKSLSLLLLDYHDGQNSAIYSVGSQWNNGSFGSQPQIIAAIAELRKIERREVQCPEAVTDELINEVLRIRVALHEWID